MQNIKSAFVITMNIFKYLFKHPKLIVPEIITTLISFTVFFIYSYFIINLESIDFIEVVGALVIIIFASLLNGFAAHSVLFMVRQTTQGDKPSVFRSFLATIRKTHRLLPIMLLSTLGKFIIAVISSLLQGLKKRRGFRRASQTKESILKRSFRMFIFIMISIEVFDQTTFKETFSKAKSLLKERFWLFASGVGVIKLASILFAIPPIVILLLVVFVFEVLNLYIILGLFIYLFLIGAMILVVEVIFISQLYIWNSDWETARRKAIDNSQSEPSINDIEKPSLLKPIDNDLLYDSVE